MQVCIAVEVSKYRGELAALGRRLPCATFLFSKSMKGKILNILHDVEKVISVISIQV